MRSVVLALLVGSAPALAAPPPSADELQAAPPEATGAEPSVRALQLAAAHRAEVEPERALSWLKRVRRAPLLPAVRVRIGHGMAGVQLTHGLDGIDRYALTASDSWRFEIEAGWQLDRLVFDRLEIGLSRESQRLALRREQIEIEVARLYFARRRLLLDAARSGGAPSPEMQLEIDELTALLDGLTGGALSAAAATGAAP